MRNSRLYTAIVLLALNSALSGCTLTNYGVGSLIDTARTREFGPEVFASDAPPADTPKLGAELKLRLRDGEVVTGKYLGVEPLPGEEYAERYARARERQMPRFLLPALGDTVSLRMTSGAELAAEFLGFDHERSVLLNAPTPIRLLTTNLREITGPGGATISGAALDSLIVNGDLPVLSALALEVKVEERRRRVKRRRLIPLDSVVWGGQRPRSGRTVGLVSGLAVDVTTLIVMLSNPDFNLSPDLDFGGG
ncbi:MAG: hypothetical protein PVG79_04415 [Gemmatimonadales bacterium]|jgi:hypothetical protein